MKMMKLKRLAFPNIDVIYLKVININIPVAKSYGKCSRNCNTTDSLDTTDFFVTENLDIFLFK